MSESGYYDWRGRPDPPRTLRRIWLAGEIADVQQASHGTHGALRVTAELRYGRSVHAGHNAVEDIMRELGLKGLPTRRLPRGAKLAKVTSVDLILRVFRRDRPNELWLTDITEHPTREGKSTSARFWTRSPGWWSADRSTRRRPPRWFSTSSGWPLAAVSTGPG